MATSAVNANPAQAIYSALNQTSSSTSGSSAGSSSSTSGAVSDQQTRFLKLLTAQLQNQDPLNPLDNAQMTSQLAEISTVDGITQLNATLQTLLNGTADSQAMQAAALVGQAVLVPGSSLTLTSSGALGGVDLAGVADSVTVTIKDSTGAVVRTLNLGKSSAGLNQFTWDGQTDAGTAAAAGNYTVSVAANQGSSSVTATALSLGTVSSISRSGQNTSVNVGSLGSFAMSDIRQIF